MNLITDYEFWKKTRKDTKIISDLLREHVESITEKCDGEKFFNNLHKKELFYADLTDAINSGDFDIYHQLKNNKAKEYRASSCFFRLYDDIGTTPFLKIPLIIKPKKIISCVNARKGGLVFKQKCDDCPHYKELVVYQSLNKQLKYAKKKQEIAKQTLLDNFRFWKTK